jgi:polysaccharide deacetylase 2 family uncharacterized protein YibQ
LLRFDETADVTIVQLPVDIQTVDLNFTNFQLTRFLNKLGWAQVSGIESANQNLQTLTFVAPDKNAVYRFRIFYDRTGAYPQQLPKVSIVIKGFGSLSTNEMERWLSLDKNLTFSILPINRVSRMNMIAFVNNDFETLLELPLESPGHPVILTESYAIFAHFRDNEVIARLDQYFRLLSYVSGVITHRGGLIKTDRRIMPIILNFIRQRNLYFIDDRAIETSIAFELAQQMMIQSFERALTLNPVHYHHDNNNVNLLNDLRNINRNPMIITLNTPDDETFEFVQRLIVVLRDNGYELVRVSNL